MLTLHSRNHKQAGDEPQEADTPKSHASRLPRLQRRSSSHPNQAHLHVLFMNASA